MVELRQLIGDGKDMKKELNFKYIADVDGKSFFTVQENEEILVKIDNDTLTLSTKELFENIFSDIKCKTEISITNDTSNSADAEILKRQNKVFETVEELINQISEGIEALFDENQSDSNL